MAEGDDAGGVAETVTDTAEAVSVSLGDALAGLGIDAVSELVEEAEAEVEDVSVRLAGGGDTD